MLQRGPTKSCEPDSQFSYERWYTIVLRSICSRSHLPRGLSERAIFKQHRSWPRPREVLHGQKSILNYAYPVECPVYVLQCEGQENRRRVISHICVYSRPRSTPCVIPHSVSSWLISLSLSPAGSVSGDVRTALAGNSDCSKASC